MHSWEDIAAMVLMRRRGDATIIRQMTEIRSRYNGDVVVPLPNMPNKPDMPPLMPQLIYDGIEHTAMRCGSVRPQIDCPAIKRGKNTSESRAADRRRALYGRWYTSNLDIKMRRAYRQLVGYGTFAMTILPCYEPGREGAHIELRDPLTTYPELRNTDDMREPLNVAFVYGRSYDYLWRLGKKNPLIAEYITQRNKWSDQIWDTVEWIDDDEIVMGILGPRDSLLQPGTDDWTGIGIEMMRRPNRAGMVPVSVPRRITLDRLAGQMQQIIPAVDWGMRLMALETIAAEKGTFPDIAIFGSENQAPSLAGNEWKDGRTGEVNIIQNAKDVRKIDLAPSQATRMQIDSLERTARVSGGIVQQFGGEMSGAVRSGRVVDSMAAMSVDPRVQELQEIMAAALQTVNEAIVGVEKGYFGQRKFTIFSGWPSDRGLFEYTPSDIFETSANVVFYSMPGTDASAQTVHIEQMVGGGLMSKSTGRRKHPLIDDADLEDKEILLQQVDDAVMAAFSQQVLQGTVPIIDAVAVRENISKGMEVTEAIRDADQQARARQSQDAASAPPEAQVPGMAQPGVGASANDFMAQQQLAPIQPPPAGLNALQSLFMGLRQPRPPAPSGPSGPAG